MGRFSTTAAILCLLAAPAAYGVELIKPLAPFGLVAATGTTNRLTLTLRETSSPFRLSDTEVSTVTGNLTGNLRLDVVGSQVAVTGLEFTGGQFALSNVNFNISIIFVGNVTASTNNLMGTINTVPAFGTVTGGNFNTADHEITLNQGTIAVGGSLVTPSTVDLAADPLSLTPTTTGTVALSTVSQVGTVTNYRARITIPVNVTEPIEGQPAEITASGNLVADGNFAIDLRVPGDYNGNGVVDTPDYTVWRDSFRSTTELAADGDRNGVVNGVDLGIWRANFGRTDIVPSLVTAAAVPEAGSWTLFAMASGTILGLGQRRRAG